MSRIVIHDIVIPIVQRIMGQERNGLGFLVIRDPALEEFLEQAMHMHFGVIGASDCQHLREQLQEALKNDPYAFEILVKKLLEKYVRLAVKIRAIKQKKTVEQGPPDRFSELRRRYYLAQMEKETSTS